MTDPRRWRGTAVLAALAVVLQIYGLYRVTGPPTPRWFPHADKVEHAVGFLLPVALLLLTLGGRAAARHAALRLRSVVAVAAVFAAHAVVSELIQHSWYAARTGDPFDVLADWAGTAVGVGVGTALLRRARSAAVAG